MSACPADMQTSIVGIVALCVLVVAVTVVASAVVVYNTCKNALRR